MWESVNRGLNTVFDLYLWPFSTLSWFWQVSAIAVPASVLALLVFRYASNQTGIDNAKQKIKAYLLELRIFKDDFLVTLGSQRQILRYSLIYMGHSLLPMMVMIGPFALIIIQIESLYAYRSLSAGESAILTVSVDGAEPVSRLDATLSLPPGLVQETPALRIDERGEINWRIRALSPGEHRIGVTVNGHTNDKRIFVEIRPIRLSAASYRGSDFRSLAYPGEPALAADSDVYAIRLDYPFGRPSFLGLSSASWVLIGVSILLGYVLRGLFRVTF